MCFLPVPGRRDASPDTKATAVATLGVLVASRAGSAGRS
jgi:hypothetical protein